MSRGTDGTKLVPQRIKEAREYRLLSVTELADKIGKSRQAVSQFENGTITPTPDILSKIASTTGFPLQYFFKEERIQNVSSSEIPIFRGSTVKTKGLKRSYEIASMWSDEIRNYLKNYLILIDVNLPKDIEFDFTCEVDVTSRIEKIADILRDFWSLGKGPIRDIVGILENNGFIVSKIPHKVKEVEAFSQWYEKIPYIFYEGNRDTSVSYTFSVCHELGHLILHQSLTENEISNVSLYKAIENQANIFAGAFLLPAETFGNEYLTSNLDSYIAIKKKWNVSLGAMIIRARNLDIIDKQQLTYLFRQLSARGYRKHEPYDDEMKFEGPSIIYSSVKMIFDNKIVNMQDFIDTIALPKDELIAVCSFPDYFIEQHLTSPRNGPHLYVIK